VGGTLSQKGKTGFPEMDMDAEGSHTLIMQEPTAEPMATVLVFGITRSRRDTNEFRARYQERCAARGAPTISVVHVSLHKDDFDEFQYRFQDALQRTMKSTNIALTDDQQGFVNGVLGTIRAPLEFDALAFSRGFRRQAGASTVIAIVLAACKLANPMECRYMATLRGVYECAEAHADAMLIHTESAVADGVQGAL
jgi:hypothetical protein